MEDLDINVESTHKQEQIVNIAQVMNPELETIIVNPQSALLLAQRTQQLFNFFHSLN